jgi:hypothetical protein
MSESAINITFKIFEEPIYSIDYHMNALESFLYSKFNVFTSFSVISYLDDPNRAKFLTMNIGPSCSQDISDHQKELFHYDRENQYNEIVYFFVKQINPHKYYGCAFLDVDIPSVIIARDSPQKTCAHEMGHLLGGKHRSTPPSNIMNPQVEYLTNLSMDQITIHPQDRTTFDSTILQYVY